MLPMPATMPAPASRAATPGGGGGGSAALIIGAVSALALPSAVLAFSSRLDQPAVEARANSAGFAPGSVDPRLAHALTGGGPRTDNVFHFTPAGLVTRPDRAVTVAVRVDPITVHAIEVRAPRLALALPGATLHLAPTAYNLGVARAPAGLVPAVRGWTPGDQRQIEMPDLASFSRADATAAAPGAQPRLAARIALDASARTGRDPRTLESAGTQTLDLGGSYRLSRNLDVTAGVRYSRDRDRLAPTLDGKSDTQAVFVGTQFRF